MNRERGPGPKEQNSEAKDDYQMSEEEHLLFELELKVDHLNRLINERGYDEPGLINGAKVFSELTQAYRAYVNETDPDKKDKLYNKYTALESDVQDEKDRLINAEFRIVDGEFRKIISLPEDQAEDKLAEFAEFHYGSADLPIFYAVEVYRIYGQKDWVKKLVKRDLKGYFENLDEWDFSPSEIEKIRKWLDIPDYS